MEIASELFYVLILLIAAISVLLISFILMFLKSQKKVTTLQLELTTHKDEIAKLQNAKVQVDHTQVQKVLSDAYGKASQMIQSIQAITDQQKQLLLSKLEKLVDQQSAEYQQMLSSLGKASDNISQNISQAIKTKLESDMNQISSTVQNELSKSSQMVQKGMQQIYGQFEKDYSSHKIQILNKLDLIVVDIFKNIASEAIGESLTKKQQELLILKALEEAKKNSFFVSENDSITDQGVRNEENAVTSVKNQTKSGVITNENMNNNNPNPAQSETSGVQETNMQP